MSKILVVDDERSIRNTIKELLEMEGHTVQVAENGALGLEAAVTFSPDLIITDIKMPEMDGIELLKAIQNNHPELQVLIISGHGTIEAAVEAIKMGAIDFIEKPIEMNRLLVSVRNALNHSKLKTENKALKRKIINYPQYEIVGQSEKIEAVKSIIEKVAPSDARVLITGENGTGKELVARQLHVKGARVAAPFVEVNCAAIPTDLIESELFGHEKGSFTSASNKHKGKFEMAEGGTIFLDEIGDMSLSAQAKVLRVLQEKKLFRVGAQSDLPINVRVLAATNKDLKARIKSGEFREDLYHRIAVINIHMPTLAERREDIPLLVKHFIKQICKEHSLSSIDITPDAMQMLTQLPYEGNIRELRNIIERIMVLNQYETITLDTVKRYH